MNFVILFRIAKNVSMDDVAASVGFAGWAFAAMCSHALCVFGTNIPNSSPKVTKNKR